MTQFMILELLTQEPKLLSYHPLEQAMHIAVDMLQYEHPFVQLDI